MKKLLMLVLTISSVSAYAQEDMNIFLRNNENTDVYFIKPDHSEVFVKKGQRVDNIHFYEDDNVEVKVGQKRYPCFYNLTKRASINGDLYEITGLTYYANTGLSYSCIPNYKLIPKVK